MELYEELEFVKNLDKDVIYYYYLSLEILRGKIDFPRYRKRALRVDEKVRDLVGGLKSEGVSSVDELVSKYDISLNKEPLQDTKTQRLFALFTPPNIVQVNTDIVLVGRSLSEGLKDEEIAKVNLFDVLLLHEIYHIIYLKEEDEELESLKKLDYKVLFLKRRGELDALEELAASLFVRYFLELSYNTEVFSLLFTYAKDKRASLDLYRKFADCKRDSLKEL